MSRTIEIESIEGPVSTSVCSENGVKFETPAVVSELKINLMTTLRTCPAFIPVGRKCQKVNAPCRMNITCPTAISLSNLEVGDNVETI